jgi:transposase
MAGPVRVRRLTEQEGQKLQRIVRRDSASTVRCRRAMMLRASVGGNSVPVIANLVQADEDTVRDAIHRFNETGLACLDLGGPGGRPRLLSLNGESPVPARIRARTARATETRKYAASTQKIARQTMPESETATAGLPP